MVDQTKYPMTLEGGKTQQAPVEIGDPPAVRPWVSAVLSERAIVSAWAISLLVHAAIFFVMLLLVFPYAESNEVVLPITRAEVIGDLLPGDDSEWRSSKHDLSHLTQEPVSGRDPLDLRVDPHGLSGAADPAAVGASGLGSHSGLSLSGIGTGSGDLSKYGISGGGGSGSDFFGLGRSAPGVRRIVYVVDRSGSMTDTFDFVRQEMKRSIGALRRGQKFHVIFFSVGEPVENPPRELVAAIPANKTQAFHFLDEMLTGGGTDPEPAMRRAFAVEPDLIYFLTDGEFRPTLIERLREWNKAERARIFTVAFLGSGGVALLEQVAREHGGEFRFITENDLP